MDDELRLRRADLLDKSRVVGNVLIGQVRDDQFVLSELLLERASEHPLPAGNENFHPLFNLQPSTFNLIRVEGANHIPAQQDHLPAHVEPREHDREERE